MVYGNRICRPVAELLGKNGIGPFGQWRTGGDAHRLSGGNLQIGRITGCKLPRHIQFYGIFFGGAG